ncbi:MOSC domain-containing protein [Phytoactinopolyspora mesophila]|uniref:MOSC domain-containing protein n=1 Tax=Phytoactinopolyspora mesophila TaxID=2650750 RepID=A0A7K3LY78_9ACTN|nr:MOSC N-terminal beta barrel domain-containing protein [Phytoactinopolyspora mesophila]NDL55632.1 MOSC domain-containing protein [Phytoactinopolyspora mesophila]
MQVTHLSIYPIKSTQGRPASSLAVEPWGPVDDRRWMLVGEDGAVVTARAFPPLLSVTAEPGGPGQVRLHGPHAEPLDVDATGDAELIPVKVWRSELKATHPSPAADRWFSTLIDHDVRLVWLDDPTRRPVDPEFGKLEDRVSFADGYPVLLATTASLRQLNDWIAAGAAERGEEPPEPLDMRRFRPNVVVENDEPFAEDQWSRVRIGDVEFRVAKPCDRCVLTTIDPDTLVKGKEPLRTLARYRRWDGKVWFAVSLIPDGPGTLNVGDAVTAL